MSVQNIRVLLADDHQITREGLRLLLANEPDMEVIAEADNGRTAVKLALKFKPDIIVMDVSMPDLNGMEATRQILIDLPKTKILGLTHTFVHYIIFPVPCLHMTNIFSLVICLSIGTQMALDFPILILPNP